MPEWQTLAGLLSTVVAVVAPALVYRATRKQIAVDEPQKIIDQLQEERSEDRKMYMDKEERHEKQLGRAFDRIEGLEAQNRIQWDYILQLRYWAAKPSQEQPPTLPQELITRPKHSGES
jgi:hypothetical protein